MSTILADVATPFQTTPRFTPAAGKQANRRLPAALDLPIFCHSLLDEFPLSSKAFRIVAHMARRAGKNGEIYSSYASMGEICFREDYPNAKPETLERHARAGIKELIEKNVIGKRVNKRANGSHGSNHYFFMPRHAWIVIKREGAMPPPQDVDSLEEAPRQPSHRKPRGRGHCPTGGIAREGTPIEGTPIEGTPLEKPTNHACSEAELQPLVGWLVGSTTDDGFGLTATDPDPELPATVTENALPTNQAEAEPPPTLPAQPPPAAALLTDEGISPGVALELAGLAGCNPDELKDVIEAWRRDCKKQTFRNPAGVLIARVRNYKFGNAKSSQNAPGRYNIFEGEPINTAPYVPDEDPPALASPLPAVAPIVPVDDPLSAVWNVCLSESLGRIDALKGSKLRQVNELTDGTPIYQIGIADSRNVGWVQTQALQRIERTLKIAMRSAPFALEVAAA